MKVLIMCLGNPEKLPRPRRNLVFFHKQGFQVDAVCYKFKPNINSTLGKSFFLLKKESFLSKIFFRNITRSLPSICIKLSEKLYQIAEQLSDWHLNVKCIEEEIFIKSYNFILVEDLHLLPLAHRLKKATFLVFDAREYYSRQFEENSTWNLFEKPYRDFLCQKYLKECDHIITVSEGLSNKFRDEFNVFPTVIRSTPGYLNINVRKTSDQIKLVHHGNSNANRSIHKLVEIIGSVDRNISLDLYLTGNTQNISKIRETASSYVNINVCNPLPYNDMMLKLNSYDAGIHFLAPNGFNLLHCLPNKFFEFIQARLAVIIGPSPQMVPIVKKYKCGFIAKSFKNEAMINLLERISIEEIDECKKNSELAAKDLCWEKESVKLTNIFKI